MASINTLSHTDHQPHKLVHDSTNPDSIDSPPNSGFLVFRVL